MAKYGDNQKVKVDKESVILILTADGEAFIPTVGTVPLPVTDPAGGDTQHLGAVEGMRLTQVVYKQNGEAINSYSKNVLQKSYNRASTSI